MRALAMVWIIGIFAISVVVATQGNKIPIKQIDDATWLWGKDSTLVRMRITAAPHDTIATYYHYELKKTTKVHRFNLQRFLDSQK